jgi:hypothetical protein
MPIVRVAGIALSAAAALSACATHMAADPPPGVNLAGAWKVDHSAGDDPQKVLDQMRAQAYKIIARHQAQPAPQPVERPGPRGGGSGAQTARTQDQSSAEDFAPVTTGPGGHRPDPLQHSPMAHVIMDSMARGDFLTIRQGPGEFVLDYGTSQRSFTPGGHSVVSAEGGVGDQTSGWDGHSYVIRVRAQSGPDVTEEYSLSPDGKQLLAKLHIGAEELPAVTLTRVYIPTREAAPQKLPNND